MFALSKGLEQDELYSNFYKLIPPSFCSLGYTYVPGWNRDLPDKDGLHFAAFHHLFDHHLEFVQDLRMWWIARVHVDEQEPVKVDRFRFRARCIFLSDFVRVQDHPRLPLICSLYPPLLQFLPPTLLLYDQAVALNGSALQFVPPHERTFMMCLVAVRDNMNMLEFVPPQFMTDELVVPLLRSNGLLIRHVPHPSLLMICSALAQTPEAFDFIKFPSD